MTHSLSKTLKKDHDIVIIDTPPKIESDARPSVEAADLVLIPMAASHVDFWATGAIVDIAKKANKKILVQINRSNQRSKLISKTNDFGDFGTSFGEHVWDPPLTHLGRVFWSF